MAAQIWPGNVRDFGSDHLTDVALDATYQLTLDGGTHIVSVYGTAIREFADLKASVAQGGTGTRHDDLDSVGVNASYYFQNTYGLTLGLIVTVGSADPTRYGTASGKPDSAAWTLQLDYTPFGKPDSFGAPYLNARLFLQFTAYDRFNGARNNYTGTGRDAAHDDTLFAGLWVAF